MIIQKLKPFILKQKHLSAQKSQSPVINLLPWREQLLQQRYKKLSLYSSALIALLILLSTALGFVQSDRLNQQHVFNNQLAKTNQHLKSRVEFISAEVKPKQQYFSLLNHLQKQANLLPYTAQYLAWLATERSDDIYYQTLLQEKGILELSGITKTQKQLDELIAKLADKAIGKVNIVNLQKYDDETIWFIVKIQTN